MDNITCGREVDTETTTLDGVMAHTHTQKHIYIYIYTYILHSLHTLQKPYNPSIPHTLYNSDVYQPPLHTLQRYYWAVRLRLSLREYCALRTSWNFF